MSDRLDPDRGAQPPARPTRAASRRLSHMQRAQDHRDVALHGPNSEAEFYGDLPVGASGGDEHQHVELARREVQVGDAWRWIGTLEP